MDNTKNFSAHSGTELYKDMQEILDSYGVVRTYKKGEIIYRQGDRAKNFCYLKKGKVKVYMNSADGDEKTLNIASHGELLGEGAFFDKEPRVSSAVALSDCRVIMIDEQILTNLFSQYPKIALELLEIMSKRIRLLSSQLDSMTFKLADERIAKILLENSKNNVVKMTHEQIADAVGVSRITVSKTLGKLSKNKIIATDYAKIILLKPEILASMCG